MKTLRVVFVAVVLALVGGSWSSSALTAATKASTRSSKTRAVRTTTTAPKTVRVRSYTKKDGTHVEAHTRSAPHTRPTTTTTRPRASPRARTASTLRPVPSTHASTRASQSVTVGRTTNGRIARSEEAKRQFMRETGYPHGRPGYVIDHIKPLACGGADAPSNMQWQTNTDAKAKDKTERIGCR